MIRARIYVGADKRLVVKVWWIFVSSSVSRRTIAALPVQILTAHGLCSSIKFETSPGRGHDLEIHWRGLLCQKTLIFTRAADIKASKKVILPSTPLTRNPKTNVLRGEYFLNKRPRKALKYHALNKVFAKLTEPPRHYALGL